MYIRTYARWRSECARLLDFLRNITCSPYATWSHKNEDSLHLVGSQGLGCRDQSAGGRAQRERERERPRQRFNVVLRARRQAYKEAVEDRRRTHTRCVRFPPNLRHPRSLASSLPPSLSSHFPSCTSFTKCGSECVIVGRLVCTRVSGL